MRFQYYKIGIIDYAPIIPIKILSVQQKWINVEAYIDSGASYSIFNVDRARLLGLDYKKGKLLKITVGDGEKIKVYLHELNVELANTEFKAIIGFSNELGVDFNLLGRKSFFEKFQICFNDKHRYVDLTPV